MWVQCFRPGIKIHWEQTVIYFTTYILNTCTHFDLTFSFLLPLWLITLNFDTKKSYLLWYDGVSSSMLANLINWNKHIGIYNLQICCWTLCNLYELCMHAITNTHKIALLYLLQLVVLGQIYILYFKTFRLLQKLCCVCTYRLGG